MKKYALVLLALAWCYSVVHTRRQEFFGRSFMYTRPIYYDLPLNLHMWYDLVDDKCGPTYGGFQFIGYYQQSFNPSKVARYFLINCKNKLLVSGDCNLEDKCPRDVRAEWLCLPCDFRGCLTIDPQQSQFGGSMAYSQDLKKFFPDIHFLKRSWLNLYVPFVIVENDLNFRQFNIKNPGTDPCCPQDILQAFNQPAWNFAKFPVRKRTRFRPAEIRATLETSYHKHDCLRLDYATILIAPIGNEQNPEFIFDPVVGNNGHWGWGNRLTVELLLNRCHRDIAFSFFTGLQADIFFRNKQCRSFDLIDKPWSRYMLLVSNCPGQTCPVPAMNVLTLRVKAKPRYYADFMMGWRVRTESCELEFGYGVWGNGPEGLELIEPFPNVCCTKKENLQWGIAGQGVINPEDPPELQIAATASESTIDCQAPNDRNQQGQLIFKPIFEGCLDLDSAASASVIDHRLHFAFGAHCGKFCTNGFLGFGIYVYLPQKNSSQQVWGSWAKIGGSF